MAAELKATMDREFENYKKMQAGKKYDEIRTIDL